MSADESLRREEEGFSRRVSNVVPARAPSTALLLMELLLLLLLLLLLMEGGGSEERLRSAAARVEITRLPHIHRLFLPARARLTAEARLTQLRLESRNLYSHSSMFCRF